MAQIQILHNSHITLKMIPIEAYNYVVNGKPAIEWIDNVRFLSHIQEVEKAALKADGVGV